MNIKEMRLPQVMLILGTVGMILATIVILTINDKDAAGVYAFGGTLLIGLGIVAGVTGQVASNTNGNTSKMLEMMAEDRRIAAQTAQTMASMLAVMTPSSAAAEQKVLEMAVTSTPPPGAPVSAPPAG